MLNQRKTIAMDQLLSEMEGFIIPGLITGK
jgi:hypothetical protein